MTRRRATVAAAVVAFLGVSALVARWLAADAAERTRVHRLLTAQARGDGAAMTRELSGCDAGCRARLDRLAARLRGPGKVEILRYDSPTARALGGATGRTRVVWRRPSTLPTVQCVTVRRTGTPVTGPRVTLLRLSAPIGRQDGC